MKNRLLLSITIAISILGSTFGQSPTSPDASLGKVDFPISCMDESQAPFNQAVALLHHMTYPEAKKSFEDIAERDPSCAMAYWGVAMSLFQPLWPTRPGLKERMEGWNAVGKAEEFGGLTDRERLFIAAADSFFRDPEVDDYWGRIRRWAHGSELTYRNNPSDNEAVAFYALSLLATAPAGGGSLDNQNRAAELLLAIQNTNPLHPGSFHYLIHANDVHGREHESLDLVRRYDDIAPRNPHALHMPTHIYTRLGDWDAVIEGNRRAAEAALQFPAGDHGEYVWDEFPHALEYLVYAYLQQGADSAAASEIEQLRTTKHLHPTFKTAFHVSSIPARYALERRAWKEAAELVPRQPENLDWDRFPWPEAITLYARALGASELGHIDGAEEALERLQVLEDATAGRGEEAFARQIRILRLGASAWTTQALGQQMEALQDMRAAADLETSTPKHPVTPAPTLPAYELLGDLFLKQGRPDSALAAFKRSLTLYPKRFNSLLGAARAAHMLGDDIAAQAFYGAIVETAVPDSHRSGYLEARAFLTEAARKDNY